MHHRATLFCFGEVSKYIRCSNEQLDDGISRDDNDGDKKKKRRRAKEKHRSKEAQKGPGQKGKSKDKKDKTQLAPVQNLYQASPNERRKHVAVCWFSRCCHESWQNPRTKGSLQIQVRDVCWIDLFAAIYFPPLILHEHFLGPTWLHTASHMVSHQWILPNVSSNIIPNIVPNIVPYIWR